MQKIVYDEFLPAFLSQDAMTKYKLSSSNDYVYDATMNPTVSNGFGIAYRYEIISKAAYRQYHVKDFDIKFIRRDQKQRRNGEACRASPTCFWSSQINLIPKDTYMVFYLCINCISKGVKRLKQMKETHSFVRKCWRRVCFVT